ncbi:DEAD-box ATP-dependent RNA helicase 53, mitochondrial-like protein [Tanacetum coccineum]
MGRLTGSRDKRTGRVVKSRSVMSKRVLCGDNNSQVVGDFGRDRGRGRESGKSRGQWRINTVGCPGKVKNVDGSKEKTLDVTGEERVVLKPAMQGRDMIGRARTGTGKTLAFGIPILDKIIQYNKKHGNPLAIVMAPTRELSRQVEKEFYDSAPELDTLCVYGGSPIQRQMSTLDRDVDVIMGTRGRVIDLLKRGDLNLSEVKILLLFCI